MKLYLVRHLPTPWNIEGKLQGNRDISIQMPLSEQSQLEIKKNNLILGKVKFDAIFASEKKRTQETALQYGFQNPEITGLINEMDFGPFEGKLKKDAVAEMGKDFFEAPFNTVLSKHYKDLEKNIRSFLELNREKNNILVFGHGSFIRGTKCIVDHGNITLINSFPLSNNEIVVLDVV